MYMKILLKIQAVDKYFSLAFLPTKKRPDFAKRFFKQYLFFYS